MIQMEKTETSPKRYSVLSAARKLTISKRMAYKWVENGSMNAVRLKSGRYLISEREVNRLQEILDGKSNNTKPL